MSYNNKTSRDLLKQINQDSHKDLTVHDFVSPFVDLKKATFVVSCVIHGNASDWGNKWQPSGKSLFVTKSRCLKCIRHYTETKDEALLSINKLTSFNVKIKGFVGDYIGSRTRCITYCKVHGEGSLFINRWEPILKELKRNKVINCPLCAGTKGVGSNCSGLKGDFYESESSA